MNLLINKDESTVRVTVQNISKKFRDELNMVLPLFKDIPVLEIMIKE